MGRGAVRAHELIVGGTQFVVFEVDLEVRQTALGGLSSAEREIVQGLARGHSVARIALARRVAKSTVAKQLENLYRRLRVSSRTELLGKLGG
jgi:DNA-binding NarL/FixJ family response regulator